MRIVQLIDSLEAGGAERMAVTIANTIGKELAFSGLVVTRLEGGLRDTVSLKVAYLFLKKKKTFDLYALLRFREYIKKNRVTIVHAHGSSYFFAILLKIITPSIKIFWHDHFGNRIEKSQSNFFIKVASFFFSGVFTVNQALENWALQHLNNSNIHFIPNFIEENIIENKTTFLSGEVGKRIVLLANLRTPKNHLLALTAFLKSGIASLGWTLHFIGKDSFDDYSKHLKDIIIKENLTDSVSIYGSCNDIQHILNQAEVGLLTSTYEGFPVTLLEYGRAAILVITSNVGYCGEIVQNNKSGICFESGDVIALVTILKKIVNNSNENQRLATNLNIFVTENYAATTILKKIFSAYQK